MASHCILGRTLREIEFIDDNIFIGEWTTSLGQLVFESLEFFFEEGDFFLEGEDGLPLDLEFFSIGVDILETCFDLLRESLCSFFIIVIH